MFTFLKLNRKISSRQQIAIKGVQDSILILPNNQYRLIIETSSINFHLMSGNEQDIIIDTYKAFLNSLPFSIQILQKVRALDLKEYFQDFDLKEKNESDPIYKRQIDHYIEYVRSLVAANKILSRRFYIVIPYNAKGKENIEVVKEHLFNQLVITEKGLNQLGIKSHLLNSFEILDLFYSSYNSNDARHQPLEKQTIDLLQRNHF